MKIKDYIVQITVISLIILAGVIFGVYKYDYNKKYEIIHNCIENKQYKDAIDKMYEYFPNDESQQSSIIWEASYNWAKYDKKIDMSNNYDSSSKDYFDCENEFCKIFIPKLYHEPYVPEYEKKENDISMLELQDLNVDGDYDSEYKTLSGSVKNNSINTVSYYEITIYMFDKNNNVVNSITTNNAGHFIGGSSSKFDTMFKKDSKYYEYKAKVTDVTFE